MYRLTLLMSLLVLSCSVKQVPVHPPENPLYVYHIQPDPLYDDPDFKLCDAENAHPYYSLNAGPKPDKRELFNHFLMGYKTPAHRNDQSGYITIRFMINCEGQTGRFRLVEFDRDYQAFFFDDVIKIQLMKLTQALKEWKPGSYNGQPYDTYYYFCFKIQAGNLIDITP